ncbi:MAG: Hpt domain-containing protein [Pirellulaceae bacterium]|jgi:HPt (histidine-containing phosphotransfer) domain-containing protein|nr:Hpt domain-containing protein [Pirellulaceae bacterium]
MATLLYSDLATDPDLSELVDLFVSEIPNRLGHLENVLEGREWEEVSRAAHQMKGAAGSYGFGDVTPTAYALELAVKENRAEDEIWSAFRDLADMCGRMRAGEPT